MGEGGFFESLGRLGVVRNFGIRGIMCMIRDLGKVKDLEGLG